MKHLKIKQLKIDNVIHTNVYTYDQEEDGTKHFNVPTNIDDFKAIAIDTLNWLIGKNILTVAGGKAIDVGTANSKLGVLLVKGLMQLGLDKNQFTELEQETLTMCETLYDAGYSDSEKLRDTVNSLLPTISSFTEKITKVNESETIEDIIEILNNI